MQSTTYNILDLEGKYKALGRTAVIDNLLIIDYSASGIEFIAECEGEVSVEFCVNKISTAEDGGCYFTVIVDGVKKERDFCHIKKLGGTCVKIATDLEFGKHTFEVYRQTETEHAELGIKSITLSGTVLNAPENRDLYIEFVGDSISTAYGNLILDQTGVNYEMPKYQDATQGYAYLTARALNADWSIVAQHGRGARFGFSKETLFDIYPKVCYYRDKITEYDFAREPDYVVINLGTNDILTFNHEKYYNPPNTREDVKEGFRRMLKLVREKNPNSKIIWACNVMQSGANTFLAELMEKSGGAEKGYYCVKLTKNNEGGNGHPYYTAHLVIADELSEFIADLEKEK